MGVEYGPRRTAGTPAPDPPVHGVPGADQVKHPVLDREPLLERRVEGDDPAERRRFIVGGAQVHGGGEDGGVDEEAEAGGEGAGAATDVECEADRRGAVGVSQGEKLVKREVEDRLGVEEAGGFGEAGKQEKERQGLAGGQRTAASGREEGKGSEGREEGLRGFGGVGEKQRRRGRGWQPRRSRGSATVWRSQGQGAKGV